MCPFNHLSRRLKLGTISCIWALSCLFNINSAYAKQQTTADAHDYLRLSIGLAIAQGGDDVIDLNFADGSNGKITAGSGASLYLGLYIDSYQSDWDAIIHIGLMDENDTAIESEAELHRSFIDSLVLFTPHRYHRLGIGFSLHIEPELRVIDEFTAIQSRFDTALGYLLQYEYLFSSKGRGIPSIGIRYQHLNYKQQDSFSSSIDASHIALSLNYIF